MDDFENAEQERSLDGESFDFAELETRLTADLDAELSDLEWLKEDREMIGNPDSLGSVVLDVVWDQFVMQIGAVAGEDPQGALRHRGRDQPHRGGLRR